ncbi:hypothetical protein QYM36_008148 [Artemia franciscana]|uniref:Uncharacterized protein n=1 Tax=Artemia franciscana TaxID=6661 RepID=A0AA88IE42_ARTSF|nr:hypothetical protein QYM36_008148 [Artemia franciscana]
MGSSLWITSSGRFFHGAKKRGISPEESEFQQEEESRSEFSGRPPRRQDLNAIEVVSQNNPSDGNIATAIDPTYRNVMPTKDREFPKSRPLVVSTPGTSYSDRLRDEESEAPPYMPIAGQRRSLSLEKKKKGRDSCKQQ